MIISLGSTTKLKFNLRFPELGLALAITGVPLGMYLNYIFSSQISSQLLMIVSLVSLFNYSFLNFGKFFKLPFYFLYMAIFHIFCLFYLIYIGIYDFLFMHLYVIFLIFLFAIRGFKLISINCLINYIYIISGICCLLGGYYIYNGFVVGDDAWSLRQETENYTLEVFTIAYAAVINFSCCMYFLIRKKFLFYSILFILCDVYIVALSGKRSPFMALIAVFFLWIAFSPKEFRGKILIFSSLIILSLCIISFSNDVFFIYISNLYKNTLLGISVLLGDKNVVDITGSAVSRLQARQWAFDFIDYHFSFINYVFGNGYMTRWLDNPLLQVFLDMGFLGFFSYLYLIIFQPIFCFIKARTSLEMLLFFSFCLYGLITILNSGTPYLYTKYVPSVVFVYLIYICGSKSSINI